MKGRPTLQNLTLFLMAGGGRDGKGGRVFLVFFFFDIMNFYYLRFGFA
jgi:hypothetical protein